MLQQTRVGAVIPYFERWMAAFPTLRRLAQAPEDRVLALWEGLGYYSRARNLQAAARVVEERHGGAVPRDPEAFRALPGVGEYTAAAVLSIAFGTDLAVVDGNVRRVLSRLAALAQNPRSGPVATALRALAQQLLPPGTAPVHNQAIMELGATVCAPGTPDCSKCPLASPCRARASGKPGAYPVRGVRPLVPHRDVAVAIVRRGGKLFIDRRPYGGLLGGLWEFPGGKVEPGETVEDTLARELREEFGMIAEVQESLPRVDHAYSHLRVTLHPRLCRFVAMDPRIGEGNPWKWVRPSQLSEHPMPRANRKIIEHLGFSGSGAGGRRKGETP
jgi:A/G-specific adenine glycosylase